MEFVYERRKKDEQMERLEASKQPIKSSVKYYVVQRSQFSLISMTRLSFLVPTLIELAAILSCSNLDSIGRVACLILF
jgi:hypothetical protein